MVSAVLAKGSEWQALYVNGRRITEDHRVSFEHGMNLIVAHQTPITSFCSKLIDESKGNDDFFPELLSDVKFLK
jgi:methylmalonyl-CoA mutase cobalamin-binding subunit